MRSLSHLTDDATVGGVSRMLGYLTSCPELNVYSRHRIVPVRRGQIDAPEMTADLIVSNLAVSWANFPLFTTLRAAYPKTPLVHIEHSYCERFVALHVKNHDRFETLLHSVYSLFDHVVAVSSPQARWIGRKGFVRADRLRVIEPLCGLREFAAIPDRKTTAGEKLVVGAIGRMVSQKGFDILIGAFRKAKLPNCELHLYGDGAQRGELMELAAGQPNIVFKGFAPDPVAAMAACDIIAMPSRWEPYGMVAIEAMAAGRPVICSRADGLLGHIAASAIDVGENTPGGWADRLEQLHRLDLAVVSERGRRHAAGAHDRFVDGWASLIEGAGRQRTREVFAA